MLEKDPLAINLLLDLSRMYMNSGQYDNLIENGLKIVELSPDNSSNYRHLGTAYLFSGNYHKALEYFGVLMEKDSSYAPQGYIGTLMKLGKEQEALSLFHEVEPLFTTAKKGMAYIHLNQIDSAFKYLNQAISEKDPSMTFLKVDPHLKMLKDDPRYLELLKRMNLP